MMRVQLRAAVVLVVCGLAVEAFLASPPLFRSSSSSVSFPQKRSQPLLSKLTCTATQNVEGSRFREPPQELVEDAISKAVDLVKAAGGSMDSLSFGQVWKEAYPNYDRDTFKGTKVTSFTKLLQRYGQDQLLVQSTKKNEVKMYVLKDVKAREQLEESIKKSMQNMEVFGDLIGSGPWSLSGNLNFAKEAKGTLPPDLQKYTKLSKLVDDLEPNIIAVEKGVSILAPRDAVTALHHLRRLSWQAKYQVQLNRLESIMRVLADVAVSKINNLSSKSIALMLSALTDRERFAHVFEEASTRLQQLANEALRSEDEEEITKIFSTQAVSVIVNAFAKTKRRDEKLFRAMSQIVQRTPPSHFDAQAVASIANGFAWADVRPHDASLFSWLSNVANQLQPDSWNQNPTAVGLTASAYHRAGMDEEDPLMDRLAQLTITTIESQGALAFSDPVLLADMIWTFSEYYAERGNGDKGKVVVQRIAETMIYHMKVQPHKPLTVVKKEDAETEDLPPGLKKPVESPRKAMEDLERAKKAVQRFIAKCDTHTLAKVLEGCSRAGVYDPTVFKTLSKMAVGLSMQSWEGAEWGIILSACIEAHANNALTAQDLAALHSHVCKELKDNNGAICKALDVDGLLKLSDAFSAEPFKHSEHKFVLLAEAVVALPVYKFTPATLGSIAYAFTKWYKNTHLSSSHEAKPVMEQLLDFTANAVMEIEGGRTDISSTKKSRTPFRVAHVHNICRAYQAVGIHNDKLFAHFAEKATELEATAADKVLLMELADICKSMGLEEQEKVWLATAQAPLKPPPPLPRGG